MRAGPKICQRDARFARARACACTCAYARVFARGVNWDRGWARLPVVTDEKMMKFLILMREKAPATFI